MAAMIDWVCAAHTERSTADPLVTTAEDGRWAFCVGGAEADHDWRRIEAIDAQALRARPRATLLELLGKPGPA
jgi:1,4-dihydroxy-2-naphthoyl-CoA synthase